MRHVQDRRGCFRGVVFSAPLSTSLLLSAITCREEKRDLGPSPQPGLQGYHPGVKNGRLLVKSDFLKMNRGHWVRVGLANLILWNCPGGSWMHRESRKPVGISCLKLVFSPAVLVLAVMSRYVRLRCPKSTFCRFFTYPVHKTWEMNSRHFLHQWLECL